MNITTLGLFTKLFASTIGPSMPTVVAPNLITQAFAQDENQSSETGMKNMSNTTRTSGKIPSMSTPGEKTYYVFTSEVENVDENKLKVAGDSYSVQTLVANKGTRCPSNSTMLTMYKQKDIHLL
jgi:hypothetical protein